MLELLSLAPVQRALFATVLAGIAFPLSGVLILEMNLITLRFALMHGVLLGGAIAVAASMDPLLPTVIIAVVLVWAIGRISRSTGQNPGVITAMLMTVSIAAAALIVYRFNVPAKDTLALIWGNVFALRRIDLLVTAVLAVVLVVTVVLAKRQITAVLFDPEIAWLAGVNEPLVYYGILALVALTVAVAMRLVGALLLDVFILLPAIAARQVARSGSQLFVFAAGAGLLVALSGFTVGLAADIPVSTAAAIPGVILVAITTILSRRMRRKKVTLS